jgi:hypothetical protein
MKNALRYSVTFQGSSYIVGSGVTVTECEAEARSRLYAIGCADFAGFTLSVHYRSDGATAAVKAL